MRDRINFQLTQHLLTALFLSLCCIVVSASAQSQQASADDHVDASNWGILGVKLGEKADKAEVTIRENLHKMPPATNVLRQPSTLRMQAPHFISPPMRFGNYFHVGTLGNGNGIENIRLSYDFDRTSVYAMQRRSTSKLPLATFDSVREAIFKKYGTPQRIFQSLNGMAVYTWADGNKIPLRGQVQWVDGDNPDPYVSGSCKRTIMAAINAGVVDASHILTEVKMNSNCGTFLQIVVRWNSDKYVTDIDSDLVDTVTAAKSQDDYIAYM